MQGPSALGALFLGACLPVMGVLGFRDLFMPEPEEAGGCHAALQGALQRRAHREWGG